MTIISLHWTNALALCFAWWSGCGIVAGGLYAVARSLRGAR